MTIPRPHDLIVGADKIGRYLGIPRQAVYRIQREGAPLFKIGKATSPLCAERDELDEWLDNKKAEAAAKAEA